MEGSSLSNLRDFFRGYRRLTYKKNEVILRAEDEPQGFYFLTKGYVRIFSVSKEGEELTLFILKAYDLFPILFGITPEVVHYYYEALIQTEAYRAPRNDFLLFLRANPDISFFFFEKIISRLESLMKRLEHVVFGTSDTKVAAILLMCAESFGTRMGKSAVISIPLTHKDIACLVGMTRETVTHSIEKLHEKGIIRHERRYIIIVDCEALEKQTLQQNQE